MSSQWIPRTNKKMYKMNPRILATKQKIKSIFINFGLLLNTPTQPRTGKTIRRTLTYNAYLIGSGESNSSNPTTLLKI
jgi:hypothetical protein